MLETFRVSERNGDAVTKRVEEIVFPVILLIANAKAFDLIDQMVSRFFAYR